MQQIFIVFYHMFVVTMPRPAKGVGQKLSTGCESRLPPWEPRDYLARWNKGSQKGKGEILYREYIPILGVCAQLHTSSP